jgi:glycosyltransferase involved in cell wall biosynthesis
MRISVVIPAYNGAGTIEQCLRAVFAADFPMEDREVMVVDDGSTDATAEILARLQGEGLAIRVIQQENRGASGARDRGIKAATGEAVFIVSQDTFAERDWFTTAMAEFVRDPRLGIVQGRVALTEPIRYPFYHAVILEHFVWNFPTVAIAYRAEALDRAGRYFDPELTEYGDDTDIAWRILEQGYGYQWLDRVTARHGVYPKGFWYPIRRTFPRVARFALLVKRHPGIRQYLRGGFLWSTPRKLGEILMLVTSPIWFLFGPWHSIGAAAVAVAAAVHRHRGTASPCLGLAQRYLVVPFNTFVCEVLGFLAMAYGSVRHRSLLL